MRNFIICFVILSGIPLYGMSQNYKRAIERGDSCMGVYDYYNALSFYRQAQVQRDDHVVRMKLADCYYHRTSYQQCANLLRAVPVDTLTHEALRELYYSLGATRRIAMQVFYGMTLVERFPRDSHVVADLIGVLLSQDYNRPEMAVMYGEQYCKTDSFNTEVNRALGEAYFIERKSTQCIDTYRRVFAAGDTTYNSLYYTAGAFEYMENLDSAVYYFTKAVEMNPKMAVGNYRLGIVENKLGRFDAALIHLKTAAELYEPSKPLMFVIYKNMGDAKYCQKNFKEAYLYWGYALAYNEDKELTEKRIALKKQLKL